MVTKVSVIIPSYQTGEILTYAIDSVLEQKNLTEIIVVDNGNPEAILSTLRNYAEDSKKFTLVTGQGNIGLAAACNLGAAKASGDVLFFMNPNSILPKDSLKQLAGALDANDALWAAGGLLRNPDGSEQKGARRRLLTPHTLIAEQLRLDVALGWDRLNMLDDPLAESIVTVPAISSACMAIRADKFERLNGFDEGYFLHVEDMDLCRRISDAGGEVALIPSLDIVCIDGRTKASSFFMEWNKAKGFIRYFDKFENKLMWALMSAFAIVNFAARSAWSAIKRILPHNKSKVQSARRFIWLYRHLKNETKPNALIKDKVFLVTGSTSQVGICTIGHLLAGGATVIAMVHKTKLFFEHPNLTWLEGDLEKSKLNLAKLAPEAVIHCAPMWMLKNSLTEMLNAKIKRVIAFSSTSVFVKIYSDNQSELHAVKALEEAELHLAERCQKAGANFTILRPTMIYGLGLDENVTQISDFAQRYHFFPLYPPADGRRMPVHADDLAQMAIKVVSNNKTYNKSYNIGGGEVLPYRVMVERIFLALGQTPRTIKIKALPSIMDYVGKWFFGGNINGEMARRMNEDMVYVEADTRRDFAFKPRGFLEAGSRDLGV